MTSLFDVLNITDATLFGTIQGVLVSLCFALGYLLIQRLRRYQWTAAALLLVIITPLATAGFWFSTSDLGVSDWDYYFSLHHTHRQTLLTYNQLPHWNPYICGGTAGVADPEFRFFTPTFLLQLAFGIPTGFRLAIWLSLATTAVGILLLGKRLGVSRDGSLAAALIATFGTVTLLEIVEGHPNVFAVMYIPWIFWAWTGAYRNWSAYKNVFLNPWVYCTSVFLALTFFQGGIYLLMYVAGAFALLPLLLRQRMRSLQIILVSGIFALGLAAVKLIPVLLWLSQFQDEAYASSALTLPYLHSILLGRYLHNAGDIIPNQGSGWHEYGAYIGPIGLLLSLIGLFTYGKNRLVRILFAACLLAITISSTGPLLKPIFDQAPFLPRSNISRVILFAVIPISLLAGFGVDSISKKWHKLSRWIAPLLLLLIAADLFSLAYPLSEQAFVLPRVAEPIKLAPSPFAHAMYDFQTRHEGADYTRAYEATIRGYGTFSYCSVLGPRADQPAVRTIHDEENNGVLILEPADPEISTSFELQSWSPNEVHATVTTTGPASIMLNTNYAKGWTINDQPAKEVAGLVGIVLPEAGEYPLLFHFVTPGFKTGSLLSIATFATILLLVFGTRYRPRG